MKKAPEAFRTISEVAELLETPAHVLRFWESKFYQIRPVKRAGGRRYYRPDDVALINGIRQLLQVQGLTIRGAQRILQEKGVRHVISLGADLPGSEGIDLDVVLAEALPEDAAPDMVAPPANRPVPPAAAGTGRPPISLPDAAPVPDDALPDEVTHPHLDAVVRLPQALRQLPRDGLYPRRDRLAVLARRIDQLLDRMSEASGAGRW
jgi:DNA-binding transcriptional MerR regulator